MVLGGLAAQEASMREGIDGLQTTTYSVDVSLPSAVLTIKQVYEVTIFRLFVKLLFIPKLQIIYSKCLWLSYSNEVSFMTS